MTITDEMIEAALAELYTRGGNPLLKENIRAALTAALTAALAAAPEKFDWRDPFCKRRDEGVLANTRDAYFYGFEDAIALAQSSPAGPTTPVPQGGEKGEPVAWQWRMVSPLSGEWSKWHPGRADVVEAAAHVFEERPLYTHPAPTRNETLENLLYRLEPFISAYEIIATRPQDYHPSVARIGGLANARDLRVQDFQRLADAVRALSTPADGGSNG